MRKKRRKMWKKRKEMLCKNLCLYITNEYFVERLENVVRSVIHSNVHLRSVQCSVAVVVVDVVGSAVGLEIFT